MDGSRGARRLAARIVPGLAPLRRSRQYRLLCAGQMTSFAGNMISFVAMPYQAGAADMVSGIFRMTMWNQTIPAGLRGRLAGLEMISYTTGEPAGNLEAGLVATATGSVRIALVSGGVLSVLGAAAVVAALPGLWGFDARAHPPPGPGGG